MTSRWRFVLRPKWLVGHLLIIAMVVLMANLAFWQLRRLHGREEANISIRSAMSAPALAVKSATLPPDARGFRHASVDGSLDLAHEALVRYPLNDNAQPGYELLTPVIVAPGQAVIVDQGWIPLDAGKALTRPASNPTTPVHFDGLIQDPKHSATPGVNPHGVPTVTAVDTTALAGGPAITSGGNTWHIAVAKEWLQAANVVSIPGLLLNPAPTPLDPPTLDNGPHLSYALQWTGFSAIAVIGWGVLLFKASRDEQGPAESSAL